MSKVLQMMRLIKINFVLAKYGLDEFLYTIRWFAPLRFLTFLNPWTWVRDKSKTRGERIRLALEELGPIFVKFGQMLSTRPDLISEEIAEELSRLQDKVPPFSGATELVEKLYECPISDIFLDFDSQALASASIAQVHRARLLNSKEVVVKVLRPGIEKTIRHDIGLLHTVAKLLERYWEPGRRLRVRDIVKEFEHTLFNELDLMREAANASQLRRNFSSSDLLYVPEVHWPWVRSKVMVMELIHGVPISNVDELRRRNVDMKRLAERGVEIFFTQVFRDCFFHADMHPGNVFVSTANPSEPRYIAVDFGIMGTLSPTDQRYLAENILAFFNRDYHQVAKLHLESGWIPSTTRIDEFEAAIRTVCEPIFERPLKDISCGQLLLRLFQTGKQFQMEIQPQLVLLQKTLLHIEGLGRQLYPDLDLWSTAKPFLERWLRKQVGPKAFLRRVKENIPYWTEVLPDLPRKIERTLEYFYNQDNREEVEVKLRKRLESRGENARKSGFLSGVAFALLGLAAGILLSKGALWSSVQDFARIGWLLGGSGLLILLLARWVR